MNLCCRDDFRQTIVPLPRPGWNAELFLTAAGRLESRGGFRWEQVASRIAVHAVCKGKGMLETAGGAHPLPAGSLFVLWPGRRACYYDEPEHPWSYVWFAVEGRRAEAVLAQCGLSAGRPVRPAPPGFAAYVQQMLIPDIRAAADPFYSVRTAWNCLSLLMETVAPLRQGTAAACKLLIDSSPAGLPSVDELSGRLGVNRSTLFRHFREEYGCSPKQYMEERRFRKACALLMETGQSVKEIAAACGFTDACCFNRAFHRRFGRTPHRWRRNG